MEEKKLSLKKASIERPWLKYYTEEAINSELPAVTIYRYLWENNKHHLDRVALNYFDKKITYGELFSNIERVAASLIETGIKEGDIVTIAMPSTPEAVYLFYALSKIGAISNMVDPRSSKEELEHYAAEVHSTLLFTIDVAALKFRDVKTNTSVREVVTISPADSMPFGLSLGYAAKTFFESTKEERNVNKSLNFTKWKTFYERGKQKNDVNEVPYTKDQPVVIVHTGGTTGVPKGVILSNDNINISSFAATKSGCDLKREHNWLNIMPPFIAYGVGNGLHLPLIVGMEVILIPQFNPNEFDKLLCKYHPNHMTGVPSHYKSLLHSKRMVGEDLSYVIAPTVGGDSVKLELEHAINQFLREHNCQYNLSKGYGMSEVMAGVTFCPTNEVNAIGSVGIPLPHSVVGIFNPDTGEELNYGEIGEVQIQTPHRMIGYYENLEEESKVVKKHADGTIWIHSGDLGYMNEDGLLFIEGRMKNMIIRHDGFKVYPKRIEDTIMKHNAVESCMVVGIDDLEHVQGKLPKAYITLKDGITCFNIEAEIELLCKKMLPEYSQPVEVEVRESFPLTSIGKFDYHTLEVEACEKQRAMRANGIKVMQYKKES